MPDTVRHQLRDDEKNVIEVRLQAGAESRHSVTGFGWRTLIGFQD
jgi:hypothetical protein